MKAYEFTNDTCLEISKGLIQGHSGVNKYGKSTNVDSAITTDIWDRANATNDQDIWVAPTEARIHDIVSDDADDVAGLATLTLAGTLADGETITIGTKGYTAEEILTDFDGNFFIEPDATADETLTLAENAADTNTVTIGSHVYTFQTSLVDEPDNVLIGANASDSIDNLIAAINGAAGEGTTYGTGTVTNTDVTAAVGAGDTLDATAILAGTVGNNVATTDTLAGASAWGSATLTGGTNDVSVTIDNLIAAINLGAGSGTKYAASMTANSNTSSAIQGAGDTMTLFTDEAIATTETSAQASWGGALSVLGAGARSTQIWGLTSWDLKEVTEIVFNRGLTVTPTVNSYVIIHRKKAVGNAGTIKATAQIDGTITSQIDPGNGKTLMCILGIPSTQTLHISGLAATITGAGGSTKSCDMDLLVNPEPNVRLDKFLKEHSFSAVSAGTSSPLIPYLTCKMVDGPAIIKIQGTGSADNLAVAAWIMGTLTPKI